MSEAQMDEAQRQHFEELKGVYRRRLNVLELKAAHQGQSTPAEITLEIEDIRKKINDIDAQLAGQAPSAQDSSFADTFSSAPLPTSKAGLWVLLAALLSIGGIALFGGYRWGVSAEQQRAMPTIVAFESMRGTAEAALRQAGPTIASLQTAVQAARAALAQQPSLTTPPNPVPSPGVDGTALPDPNMAVTVTSRENRQFTVSFEKLRFKDTIAGLTLATGETYYFKDMQRFRITNAESANSDVEITLLDGTIVTGRVNDCERCYLSGTAREAPGEDLFEHLSDVRRVEFDR